MKPLDYGRSFLIGKTGNRVRFVTDARTRIYEHDGSFQDFHWAAPCKSERTFAKEGLFTDDNYDGSRIFGPNRIVWYRKKSSVRSSVNQRNENWRMVYEADWAWGGLLRHDVEAANVQELTTNEDILQATYDFWPIVAQTEIWDDETGLRAVIEYPVKTMNTTTPEWLEEMAEQGRRRGGGHPVFDGDERSIYQVDTGPVAFPDLTRRHAVHEEGMSLAFVAFNSRNFSDFILDVPTPVMEHGTYGKQLCEVHHYSKRLSLPAENRLYAIK